MKDDMAKIEAQRRFTDIGLLELAAEVGISKSHLHRLLTGEQVATEEQARKILAALRRRVAAK
jgi:transcriptional regulator with XRE-family HTH domain